ncbi:WhiB family transcriptional regulator, redox-sensing transcriptional regulator [Gordonia malaquae]|jgi:WhiB family redox-sensing transcriptional regulator|nr:WhiB family transcriptional regulator, redox-sensing transcriptional regulator [Gordonia malaquae]
MRKPDFMSISTLPPTIDTTRRRAVELPCQSGDADLWFADQPSLLEEAKTLCGSCPLQAQCLELALERAEPWGVWGGEIFDGGVVIARKRPRGRPRKNAVA